MPPRPGLIRVPTVAQVVPGARVHIVLKQDQPTGRTVDGVVQTVLTRGNHPRGIKVRLSDGRVGRVQTMGDGRGGSAGPAGMAGPAESRGAGRGVPAADGEAAPREQIGLDAFIRPARPRQQKRQTSQGGQHTEAAAASGWQSPAVTCPVCGAFEGDEAAVAHHVASHFDA